MTTDNRTLLLEARATLNQRLAAVKALPETGYVQMMHFIAFYCETPAGFTGLENATVYDRPTGKFQRNRAGDCAQWKPMAYAKVKQIESLERALIMVQEMVDQAVQEKKERIGA
jgi:hypothetical protein